ncbi:MAG: hypothetical protein GY758_29165 [Fuerstiella sp.]|nr:hypothetical protein [Fuerstiella sp.]MCP4785094.1 hypothetical protein [Fuerstiella sp.]
MPLPILVVVRIQVLVVLRRGVCFSAAACCCSDVKESPNVARPLYQKILKNLKKEC